MHDDMTRLLRYVGIVLPVRAPVAEPIAPGVGNPVREFETAVVGVDYDVGC
jgi:hypothetical protein